jgi:NAD(P)-dependent dehydrogenase (short-subunit alcohol dehydrogenase family)
MSEQVVLVTGGSGGIGMATATLFAARGFVTYATDRSGLHAAELESLGCRPVKMDVTDEDSIRVGVDLIRRQHGGIDILVNCAGYSQGGLIENVSLSAFRRQFDVNVFGLIRLVQLVVPDMRRRGSGRIVNVSSLAGRLVMPGMGAYGMSKHAVECLSDVLRYELRSFGIDVVTIEPSGVSSNFTNVEATLFARGDAASAYGDFNERVIAALQNNPMELQPDEVACTIFHAATVARPKRRYPVGALATALLGLRSLLPDRAWDVVASRIFPMP